MTDLRDQLAPKHPATCHPQRRNAGRGLCGGCYEHHRRAGTIDRFPRATRPLAHFAEDYALLRSAGYGRHVIAARLGMKPNSVDRAYVRAVRAGLLTPDRRTP